MKKIPFIHSFIIILSVFFISLTGTRLSAQIVSDSICGFSMTEEELVDYVNEIAGEKEYMAKRKKGGDPIVIPLRFTVRRFDDGSVAPANTEPIDQTIIDEAIANLNNIYEPMDVIFVQCGPINYIDNTKVGLGKVSAFYFSYVSNAIDVRVGFTGGNSSTLGSASAIRLPFATNNASVYVKYYRGLLETNTLAHEIGHHLHLVHTFNGASLYDNPYDPIENSPEVFSDEPHSENIYDSERELVIREVVDNPPPSVYYPIPNHYPFGTQPTGGGGDYISDTPAWGAGGSKWPDPTDPDCFVYVEELDGVEINGPVNCSWGVTYDPITCEYTGNYVDYNGHELQNTDISIRNIMSYTGSCRTEFTPGQFDRMIHANETIGVLYWDEPLCGNLADKVEYWGTDEPIKNVTISIVHPEGDGKHCRATTNSEGIFNGVLFDESVKTKVAWIGSGEKNNDYDQYDDNSYDIYHYTYEDWKEGVSTADIIRIAKHILGVQPFDNGYQYLAADVSNNGFVSTIDVIMIRRLILGMRQEFENIPNGPWRFVPEYIPANYGNEFDANPFNLTLGGTSYTNEAPYMRADWEYVINDGTAGTAGFDGVKMGDVTGDALDGIIDECPEKYAATEFSLPIPKQGGKLATLHIKSTGFDDVVGFQLAYHFDTTKLEIKSISSSIPDFTEDNIGYPKSEEFNSKNDLRFVWVSSDLSPKSFQAGESLFEIIVQAKEGMGDISDFFYLDNEILKAEFYDLNGCTIPVQLEKQEIINSHSLLASDDDNGAIAQSHDKVQKMSSLTAPAPLLFCFPNPSAGDWTMAFRSLSDTDGKLVIRDINGKILLQKEVEIVEGINEWDISRPDWPEGILWVSLQTKDGFFTQRIVYLK